GAKRGPVTEGLLPLGAKGAPLGSSGPAPPFQGPSAGTPHPRNTRRVTIAASSRKSLKITVLDQFCGDTHYGAASTCPQPGWLLQGVCVDRDPPALRPLATIRVPPSRASAERPVPPRPVELTTRMVLVMSAQAGQHAK